MSQTTVGGGYCLCGAMCMGASDHFLAEGKEFYVHTMFYHFWFLPLYPMDSHLAMVQDQCACCTCCNPEFVVQLRKMAMRSVRSAWIRALAFLLPIVTMADGCSIVFLVECGHCTDETTPQSTYTKFYVVSALSCLLLPLWYVTLAYKPKASAEKKEEYLQLIGPFLASPGSGRVIQLSQPMERTVV